MRLKKRVISALAVGSIAAFIPISVMAEETGTCFVMSSDGEISYTNKTLAQAASLTDNSTNYWITLNNDMTTDGVTFKGYQTHIELGSKSITGNITIENDFLFHGSAGSSINGTIYVHSGNVSFDTDITVTDWELSGGTVNFEPAEADLAEGYVAVANDDGTWTIQEEPDPSGTCGTNLSWVLTDDGVLTISGEGAMSNYSNGSQPWYEYRNSITSVVIEDGVTNIGSWAFGWCSSITQVSIPDSVQSISSYAFYYCSSINNVVVPEGITSLAEFTFYHCNSMRNLTLPSTLKDIGRYALGECWFGDLVVPEGVERLTGYAFYMSNWDSLTLPATITTMGDYVFSNCGGIRGIITTPAGMTYIPQGTYAMCGNLTGVVIADGVKTINYNAFRYCGSLKEVWIPESVTSIDSRAFYGLTPANITIYGKAGSTAETYATTYGYNFVVDEEEELVAKIITQPEDQTVVAGQTAVFQVEAEGEDLTYQWQYSTNGGQTWSKSGMTGADTNTLSVKATTSRNGQMYRCVVTDAYENKDTSNAATLILDTTTLTIVEQPRSQTIVTGERTMFYVQAEGEELTYQWQYRLSGGTSWSNSGMTGNKTNTLEVKASASRNGQSYRCIITDANGAQVITNEASLSITENASSKIVVHPVDQSGTVDETVSFSVQAEGDGLTYQWQVKTGDTAAWKNSGLTGSKTDTLSVQVKTYREGQQYRCIITDSEGNQLLSNGATLYVAKELKITQQPEDKNGEIGDTVEFSIIAEGVGLTYQWQVQTTEGGEWKNSSMTGSKTDTLSVEVKAYRDGQKYRCIVTDMSNNTVTSEEAELIVGTNTELVIITQPEDYTGVVDTTAEFSVEAEGRGLTYQWQVKTSASADWKNSGMTGSKTDTLSVAVKASRDGQQYRCIITDANGNTVTTNAVVLTVSG